MEPLRDERLTLVGLFTESYRGLVGALERGLEHECALSRPWFELLLRLARSPEHRLRMSDLAVQTGLTPSGLTRAVDRLEEAGLVTRVACPSDRRGSFAVLTEAGLGRVTDAVIHHLRHVEENLTGVLTAEEQRQFGGLLRKVRDHVHPGAATVTPPDAGEVLPPETVSGDRTTF